MRARRRCAALAAALLIAVAALAAPAASASPSQALDSVVSVLPQWPGRAQGGNGGPPGVAPEGSGVVLRPGVVATAWHVVEPAQRIEVRLHDGRILPARLIGADAASDIALLSVDAELTPITPAPGVEIADPVCAIGNAYGLGLSVTCGVVSARAVTRAGFNPVEDFVQTDAAANPGSSGGALVDAEGRLVGMVSAIFASSADANIGVNFAVSVELLDRVADALLSDGDVRYPEPGWRLGRPDRAQLARLSAPIVASIRAGGPAEAAGVAPGDLVIQIGDRRILTPRDANTALAVLPQDAETVAVTLERDGARRVATLMLGAPPPEADAQESIGAAANAPSAAALPVAPVEPLGDCPHPAPVCRLRQAVFPISSFDPVGSATRIGPTLLVTNRHVVGDRLDAVVHTPSGPRGARVIASDYAGDLALLEVEGLPEGGYIPDLASDELDARGAETLHFIGADVARQEIRVFDPGGLIATPAPGAPFGRIHTAAPMQPGVSGGALVDAEGVLIGIAVGGGDGRFEAIPLEGVRALLSARASETAEATTRRLGAAFVACAEAIDAASAAGGPQQAPEEIETLCAEAQNTGQLLTAGRLLSQLGAFDAAAALHAQAVARAPNSINARISLLVSLQLGARFEDMTAHARRLFEMAPGDPQALRFAIQAGVWGGDPDLAEAAYAALLEADPRQAEAARRFIDAPPPRPERRP